MSTANPLSPAPTDATRTLAGGPAASEPDLGFAPPEGPRELGRLGGYRIQKLLGQGGMGAVYLAQDPHLGRYVAIKVLQPRYAQVAAARERFLREARAVAALEDDHIVPIYQVSEDRGLPFIVMPRLRGETLETRLQRMRRLPTAQVIELAIQMAAGLTIAHEWRFIHRDIKPANIWLEAGTDRVKILDFGLVQSPLVDTGLTRCDAIIGTPGYMAPEQAQHQKVDERADLFSLGCVLYRAATGEKAFEGVNEITILNHTIECRPVPPSVRWPQVPQGVAAGIMQLLQADPAARPQTAAEVRTSWEQLREVFRPATDSGSNSKPPPSQPPVDPTLVTVREVSIILLCWIVFSFMLLLSMRFR
jgi:serine/threonine protein kinase